MVAIGKQLRRRGIDVVISLAEPYADVAQAADLQVESVFSRERFDELLGDADVWKPIRGMRRVLGQVAAQFLSQHNDVIRKHHRPGQTILISHPLDFASCVFRESDPSTPLVDVHLAPATLRVPSSPGRLSPWWFEIRRPTWAVKASYWAADRLFLDPTLTPSVGKLRDQYGLPKINRYLDQWWLSPDRILAMFPEWFAPATSTVLTQLMHVGFPLADLAPESDDTLERLQRLQLNRPVIFTAGTAHHHCGEFFRRAVEACDRLRCGGILLSTHGENIPNPLPQGIVHATYAPLGQLLAHASAIVHHGGIGTTSQSLAAGVPQVIRANAFDQFDNATRVQRLGCGRWLKRDRQLTDMLDHVRRDAGVASACDAVKRQLSTDPETSGAEAAAIEIESMLSRL